MPEDTVLPQLAEAIVSAIASDPQDVEQLASGLKWDPTEASEPARQCVPLERYVRLWELASERSADPYLGLRLAERDAEAASLGAVGATLRHSRSLGEALGYAARYARVVNEACDVTLAIEGDLARLRHGPQDRRCIWPRHAAEQALASYVTWGRLWTGVAWTPTRVSFQHAAPVDIREHRRVFGCPVLFKQPRNELEFSVRILELPIVGRSAEQFELARREAETKLDERLRADTLVTQVRRFVRRQGGGPDPSVEDAARALGLSTRTLQRRLSDLDTSYTSVVDDVRRRTALELLRQRSISVAEIARRLGFSDAKAFRRAFRRWTGASPRQYRAA